MTMLEWHDELDYYELMFHGYKCEIKRNALGALCGYLHLTNDHAWNKTNMKMYDIDVHGMITYQQDNVVGFDCAHIFDYVPHMSFNSHDAEYRNVEYVSNELEKLAFQALSEETFKNKLILKWKTIKNNIKIWLEAKLS